MKLALDSRSIHNDEDDDGGDDNNDDDDGEDESDDGVDAKLYMIALMAVMLMMLPAMS